jgi:hypothetical protein
LDDEDDDEDDDEERDEDLLFDDVGPTMPPRNRESRARGAAFANRFIGFFISCFLGVVVGGNGPGT